MNHSLFLRALFAGAKGSAFVNISMIALNWPAHDFADDNQILS